jgi:hypothetical protein
VQSDKSVTAKQRTQRIDMRTRRSVRLTNIAEKTAETRKVVDRATVYALDGIVSHVMFDRVHTRTRIAAVVRRTHHAIERAVYYSMRPKVKKINEI